MGTLTGDYSEPAAYGGELVDGRGVGGAAAGVCERAAAVRIACPLL